jgi:hypothetical protein
VATSGNPIPPITLPTLSVFPLADTRLTPVQFGNLQKLDGPTEQCQDPLPSLASNCTDEVSTLTTARVPRTAGGTVGLRAEVCSQVMREHLPVEDPAQLRKGIWELGGYV